MESKSGSEGPRLIAHRGFAAVFPENTVTAIEGAIGEGAELIEVDCRECGTGEIVLHHDERVNRLTSETGRVSEYSASALQSMEVLDSGEGIPTLEAIVDILPEEVGLNLHLKERNIARKALASVADIEAEVIVSSFDRSTLNEAASCEPNRPLALLIDQRPGTAVRRATAADCSYIHPKAGLCVRSLLVRRAHQANLDVNVWTLRSPRFTRVLEWIGVDGIIADTPAVL